ncbi:MAG: BACON domain-containing protein [Blastocatellia bacterium]
MKRSHWLCAVLLCLLAVTSFRTIAALQSSSIEIQAQTRREVRGVLDRAATVHAAGRINPLINLRDGHALPADYQGGAQAVAALRALAARPVSLASADFDEDGVPDLAAGYAGASGGVVVVQRGDVDAVYPNTATAVAHRAELRAQSSQAGDEPSPFLVDASAWSINSAPQFMAAGDFDADGHADLITGEFGGTAISLLKGDGRGGLVAARAIKLPAKMTAAAVADVNRMDGLADLVVAVSDASGARLLVFEDGKGAINAAPEIISLPAAASAIVITQLDNDYPIDIAVACERDLLIIQGRDRHHATVVGQQRDAMPPVITRLRMAQPIVTVAAGDFAGDDINEIAVLTSDGICSILSKAMDWKAAIAIRLPVNAQPPTKSLPPSLLALRWSDRRKADLIVNDHAASRLHVVTGDAADSAITASSLRVAGAFDVEGDAVAVLPMRLNSDALDDLVVLRNGASQASVLMTAPLQTFTVTNTNDSGAGSLRDAMTLANQNAGADAISFNITGSGTQTINLLSALPIISGAVTLDGSTQNPQATTPPIELNGAGAGPSASGINISSGSCVVRGLVINRFDGIGVAFGGGSNYVEGCYIGTNATGLAAQSNGDQGVSIAVNSNNTVGGTVAAARNVISGNNSNGVVILGPASGNLVQGNYIGTNASGTAAVGNAGDGIGMVSAANTVTNTTIGGTVAGAGNLISGNNGSGVQFFGVGTGNLIQGNLIGVNASGAQPLGNVLIGIVITDATATTIGGSVATAANVISGNGSDGVRINASTATNNAIKGNRIGTSLDGATPLANVGDGVIVLNSASSNTIGGAAGEGNIIAFNNGAGVRIDTGTGNAILTNAIFANTGLGIDLSPAGVTANDTGDGDSGANTLQNFPVLQTANSLAGGGASVQGTLNSTVSATFTIQFFANDTCDASGNGEGQLFLGAATVMTNASGNVTFNATLTGAATTGQFITATATDAAGNTSEFSACLAYGAADMSVTESVSSATALLGSTVTYTITVTNNGPDLAQSITLTDNLPSAVAFTLCTAGSGVCGGSGNNRSITFNAIAAGSSATVTIAAIVNCNVSNGTLVNNVASVTAATRDPLSSNNSAAASFTASDPPAMLAPTSETFSSDGGASSVQVSKASSCLWLAQSNAPWITIAPPSGGFGDGTITYNVAPNTTGSPRAGTLTIAGQVFTVNQTTTPCQYTLNPTSANYMAIGGNGMVNVTVLAGCTWKPISNVVWITVPASGGSGSGSFRFTVLANPSSQPRTGVVTVGAATFTVMQDGAPCVFTLSRAGKLIDAGGDEVRFDLNCPLGCNWNATVSDAWITLTSDASGSGPTTVSFLVRGNSNPTPRQGSITIGGKTFAIVQDSVAAASCTFQIAPMSIVYDAAGGGGNVQLSTSGTCAWEAASNVAWVQVTSSIVGIGAQTITYHVDANASTAGRAAVIRVGTESFRIKQKGSGK